MYLPDQRPSPRHRFEANHLETASPARILTMCFDRLDRDLATAGAAVERQDHPAAHTALTHAQDLLGELAAMLDVNGWQHAGSLLAVYDYLLRLLARANFLKDGRLIGEAERLVAEIGEAFREAAGSPAAVAAPDAAVATPAHAFVADQHVDAVATSAPVSAFASSASSAESTLAPTLRLSVRA